ncbi:MAG: DnaJ C-terminal domain-containing protein [Phycisphaerales bacterium]|jgi:DnaJ-class molecular chaperone|nr:DnaJ C-terminal domain-containing protein [Phycisphaerales bacterium]
MAARDPYEVLGVSRSATEDEIRAAYRKLARTHHPDVSTEPDADKKFAEVQEAYEILSDAEKRAAYDRFGRAGGPGASSGPGGPAGGWGGQQVDPSQFEDIFEQMFGGGGRTAGPGGFGAGGPRATRQAPQQGGNVSHTVSITFQTAARGGTEHLELQDGSQVDLRIPAGIEDGAKLRIRGRGGMGAHGGGRGDVIVTVNVGRHPWLTRQGLDLSVEVPITIAEASLGTTVRVSLLKGSVDLRIPPGSSSGTRLRVRGQGLAPESGDPGDLYAVVAIAAPKDLSDADKARLEDLSARLPDPRTDHAGVESISSGADS